MVFNYNTFISNVTFADYERLQKTKDYAQREALVKKAPYVLLLILKSWNDNDEELKKLIKTGIMYCDDFNLLSALKERDGFKVLPEYVNASVYANPEFIFDLTEEEKNLVSRNALIDAFVRDCRILSSGCPALNKRSELITFKKMEDGVEVTKYRHCTLRSQLLTAIRIATGVYSPSDKGYDDFAMKIAKRLITIQQAEKFENMTNIQELMNEVPTVMNGLIKKQHQMVRLCKGKALRLNNFKCLHAMIKEEAKDNSKLKGLHNDIPKSAVPEKTFENAIAKGIKTNYKFYDELEEEYKSKFKFKFAYLKAIRDAKGLKKQEKRDLMDKFLLNLDEEEQKKLKKSYNRSNGGIKAAQTRKEKKKQVVKIEPVVLEPIGKITDNTENL